MWIYIHSNINHVVHYRVNPTLPPMDELRVLIQIEQARGFFTLKDSEQSHVKSITAWGVVLLLLELVVQVEVPDLLRMNPDDDDDEYPAVVGHLALFADDGWGVAAGISLGLLRFCDTLLVVGGEFAALSSAARNFFCKTMNGKEVGSPVSLV